MTEHEVLPFVGKGVEVVRNSGALYRGTLHRTGRKLNGDPKFALVRVTIINKHGGETSPKYGETRRISAESIKSIKLCDNVSTRSHL